jgi:Rod binding domain-containing protein
MDGINGGITPAATLGTQPKGGLSPKEALRLRESTADFESMFVKQMLTSMRKAIPKQEGGLIKESEGEKMFRDMLDAEYAKTTSRSGQGMGLGAAMYKQLVARFGLEAPGTKGHIPSVSEAKQLVDNLRNDASAIGAAGYKKVGNN